VIFAAWVGDSVAAETLPALAATTRLLFVGHGFYIAALPFYYALLGVGQHRVFGVGMLAIAALNTALGWLAAGAFPRIETLAAVYGVLMLGLAGFVTLPAGLRRFPLSLARLFVRAFCAPLAAAVPGALGLVLRPRLGRPLLDLGLDAALFAALCLPGLELARRRLGLPLAFGSRTQGGAEGA
jgi:hypothetical protein